MPATNNDRVVRNVKYGPQAKDDTGSGLEDGVVLIDVLANDLAGGANHLWSLDQADPGNFTGEGVPVTLASGATVHFDNDAVVYDPGSTFNHLALGQQATDTFTYAIRMANGVVSYATVTVTITGENDGPVAVADAAAATEDGALIAGNVGSNDSDADNGATLSFALDGAAPAGLTFGADGNWSFDPSHGDYQSLAAGETLDIVVSYTVTDEHGAADSATLTITVTGTNDIPVAVADTAAGLEHDTLTIDVLANDTDVDHGAVLSVVDAAAPDGQGSVAITGNQLVFDPGSDFDYLSDGQTATVTLSYTIQDEHGAQSSSTVTVTVTGTNDAPIIGGGDFSGAVVEAEPVTGIPAGSTPILVETGANDLFEGAQLIDRGDLRIADNPNLGDDSDPAISVQGQIDSATDQDVYSIQLQAGETLTLDVDFGLGFGSTAYPGYGTIRGLDSFVSIYDSAGNLLNLNDDAPTGLGGAGSVYVQDSFLQFTATTPGTYYVVVHDYNDLGAMSQGPYTMQVSVDSQALQITDTGTMSFSDVDLADGHGVTVTPQDGGYLGTLTAGVTDAATGDGAGTVRWDFSVANAAVQYLAEGQTLVQTYTVAVSDGAGGTDEESVTITITGTNDTPVITNALSVGDIVEGAQLGTGGQVFFTEVDLTDGHSVTSSADESGYYGTFSATLADSATGDGSGQVDWAFSVDDAEIQHLAAGQWLVQHYTITIDDGHGGTTQQLVNVTITGTNDGVVIEGGDASGSVTELANASAGEGTAILGDSGSILFSDVDTADLHNAGVTNMGPDYLGSFTVGLDQGTDTISWNFEVSDGALESLAAGEVLTQVYQVSVSDGRGGVATQDVTITITGAADNSPPTITSSADEHEGSVTAVATEAPGDNAPATELAASYLTAGNSLINGLGGSEGFGESLLARNDDGSTGFIDLSAIFGSAGLNFFGSTFNGLYINNNGNVTFNFPTFQYNPSVITGTTNNPTIAAFWDDVDTRNSNGQTSPGGTSTGTNLVYYDIDPVNGVFTVTWNDTGEYSNRNVPNAFQIQLIRRGNEGDFDIVLRYESVNWSTGARAGYTAGNGQDYFELPQSGSDPAMLALESTVGNTGIPGVFVFEVRDGQVFTGTHNEAGTISFADIDVTDTHSATVEALDDGYLGTLVLGPLDQAQNQVSWSFSVANDDLLGLAEGEVATQVYRVTISDGNGGTVSQDVTVTLTGRNDGPTATADTATGGENDVLTLDALANDTDPDQGDQLSLVEASVGDGQGGSVSIVDNQLVFDPGTDFDYLEEGQTAVVEVAYTMQDQHGVQSTSNVEITVTGAADGPPWVDGDFNAAFVTGASAPWGATSAYAGSMDTAFGAGEWDQLNAPTDNIFDDGYDFIWLDGGNGQTGWFEAFVNEYRDEMEAYVAEGGTLYINAGRWSGTANFDLGFSVQITNNGFASTGTATGDASELVNGPNGYAGTSWTGNYFSHDFLTGTGLTTLITGNGQTILAELDFGEGHVVFGGLTSSAFHNPDPQAAILEANILDHAASFAPDYFI